MLTDPVRSRKASSIEAASTTAVTVPKTVAMALDTAVYRSKLGSTNVARGASRRACGEDIPDRTPSARASYVADSTTPRGNPPTMTGRPRSSGRYRTSTEA